MGSPLDVFSANYGTTEMIPTPIPLPPPKYQDAFPRKILKKLALGIIWLTLYYAFYVYVIDETPGQVAEMLKDPELTDSEEAEEDSERESRRGSRNTSEIENELRLDRENVYTI